MLNKKEADAQIYSRLLIKNNHPRISRAEFLFILRQKRVISNTSLCENITPRLHRGSLRKDTNYESVSKNMKKNKSRDKTSIVFQLIAAALELAPSNFFSPKGEIS